MHYIYCFTHTRYTRLGGRSLFSSGYASRSDANVPDVLSDADEGSASFMIDIVLSISPGAHLTTAHPSAHWTTYGGASDNGLSDLISDSFVWAGDMMNAMYRLRPRFSFTAIFTPCARNALRTSCRIFCTPGRSHRAHSRNRM